MAEYFKVAFVVLVSIVFTCTIRLQLKFYLQSSGALLYTDTRSKILDDTVGFQFRHSIDCKLYLTCNRYFFVI